MLTDSHQSGSVVGHRGHTQLHHGALRSFAANLSSSATEQTGHMAFDHQVAVATGTSQLHLVRRPLTVQTGRIEHRANLLGARFGVDWLGGLWDADREHASLMMRLTLDRVIDAEITGQ